MSKEKIYAIILNYKNAYETIECLQSFNSIVAQDIIKVVVDNNSDDDCIKQITEYIGDRTDCIFLETGANLGYAGGNNVGIKYAMDNNADYIAIVNNDVVVNSESFIECINILKNDSEVAFVGPAILEYGSNCIQYTGGTINYDKITSPHMNSKRKYIKSDEKIYCDYVGGACMVFSKEIIKKIGLIPECYFLFWEETEWCTKAIQAGMKCVCTMGGYINHKGSVSIKKIKGIEEYYLERNRIIFSLRNDPIRIRSIIAIFKLLLKTTIKGLLKNKQYFTYLGYYFDGILKIDRYH